MLNSHAQPSSALFRYVYIRMNVCMCAQRKTLHEHITTSQHNNNTTTTTTVATFSAAICVYSNRNGTAQPKTIETVKMMVPAHRSESKYQITSYKSKEKEQKNARTKNE